MGQDAGEHQVRNQQRASALAYGSKWEAITPHDEDPIPRHYKYVLCSADGTAVMLDVVGTSLTLEFEAGDIIPVLPTVIHTDSTGSFVGVIE